MERLMLCAFPAERQKCPKVNRGFQEKAEKNTGTFYTFPVLLKAHHLRRTTTAYNALPRALQTHSGPQPILNMPLPPYSLIKFKRKYPKVCRGGIEKNQNASTMGETRRTQDGLEEEFSSTMYSDGEMPRGCGLQVKTSALSWS